MTFCAQYGNPLSFYGNIQEGQFLLPIQSYGGWPDDIPRNSPMVNNYPTVRQNEPALPEIDVGKNIAIIKQLREQLLFTENAKMRSELREQIELARQEKVRTFQMRARIDEEESIFILFN